MLHQEQQGSPQSAATQLLAPLFQHFLAALYTGQREQGQLGRFVQGLPEKAPILPESCFLCDCASGNQTIQLVGASAEDWFRNLKASGRVRIPTPVKDIGKMLKDVRYHWVASRLVNSAAYDEIARVRDAGTCIMEF